MAILRTIVVKVITIILDGVILVKGAENGNAQAFAALCKVIRAAEATPSMPQVDNQGGRLMVEIYGLSNKTVEMANVLRSDVARTLKIRVERAVRNSERVFGKWNESVTNTKKYHTLAKINMRKAIYGDDYQDQTGERSTPEKLDKANIFVKTADNNNGESCGGKTGTLADAGKTLINDFYCLCIGAHNSVTTVCANGLDPNPTAWTDAATSGDFALAKWTGLKEKCPKGPTEVFMGDIDQALGAFHAQLGKGATTSDSGAVGAFLLGTSTTMSTGCTGASDAQMCVIYKQVMSDKGGIPWENRLKDAQKELRKMHEAALEARAWLDKLQDQEVLLQDLYNESVVGAENEDLKPRTADIGIGQNPTVKSVDPSRIGANRDDALGAASTSNMRRFILPWILLV